jgi:sec-independent protein translocase protein TatA
MTAPMNSLLMWTPGPWEIVIILGVLLLLFGGKKLPELARGLGRGMREFRDELKGAKKELEDTSTFDSEYHVEEDQTKVGDEKTSDDERA